MGSPVCPEFLARMASLDLLASEGHRGSMGRQATRGHRVWPVHRDPPGSQDPSESLVCLERLEFRASRADLARRARKDLQALLVPKDGLAFLDHLVFLDSLVGYDLFFESALNPFAQVREVCLVYPACLG